MKRKITVISLDGTEKEMEYTIIHDYNLNEIGWLLVSIGTIIMGAIMGYVAGVGKDGMATLHPGYLSLMLFVIIIAGSLYFLGLFTQVVASKKVLRLTS